MRSDMKTKKKEHVVLGNGDIRCLNCGQNLVIPNGITITVYTAIGKAFGQDHKDCQPSEAGKKRFEFNDPEEWLASWDTGISSRTIWSYFMNRPMRDRDVPQDPEDFGRCSRLLAKFPKWRNELSSFAEANPTWEGLVSNWDELEALYAKELPTGRAPKLFQRIQELTGKGES